jgi:hypothetical protein
MAFIIYYELGTFMHVRVMLISKSHQMPKVIKEENNEKEK